MTVTRQRLGRRAEGIVAGRLAEEGWSVVARNARTRHGEIDIVAIEGASLVFVEVKAGREGSAAGPALPEHAVRYRKRRRLRLLAAAWLADRPPLPWFEELRFDVVGVSFDREDRIARYEHIRAAF
jgi:putative endonuclease